MKRIVLPAVVVLVAGIIAISSTTSTKSKVFPEPRISRSVVPPTLAGTIDGAVHPENIPDHVAYSLLFQLIAGRQTEVEKRRIKSYIRQMGLGDADGNALIVAAEEYRVRIAMLSQQASGVLMRYHPVHPPLSAQDRNQLKQLDRQRDFVVNDIVASLPHRLSTDGLVKLRHHINERVKRKTRITQDEEPD